MVSSDSVLVIGATGQQGSAVTRSLLRQGSRVKALVRDERSDRSRSLEAEGVKLLKGDLDDPASIRRALSGVRGVFSMQSFTGTGGVEAEERQGKRVAQIAAECGIKHLVYSSVGRAHLADSVPHFASKASVEREIHRLGIAATILRPSFFMENFLNFSVSLRNGRYVVTTGLHPGNSMQMVSVEDVGRIAALILTQMPPRGVDTIEISGDDVDGGAIELAFSQALSAPVEYVAMEYDEIARRSPDLAAMWSFINNPGYRADISRLNQEFGEMTTLQGWLSRRSAGDFASRASY